MSIFKTFNGRHVDLSKIVAIGPIDDRDPDVPRFDVWFQLMDGPMWFTTPAWSQEECQAMVDAERDALKAFSGSGRATGFDIRDATKEFREGIQTRKADELKDGYSALMRAWGEEVWKREP